MASIDLAARYRELILRRRSAPGTAAKNHLSDDKQREYKRLKETAEGRAAIQALLTDTDREVRFSAAYHAVVWAPEVAIPVIEELSAGDDFVAFGAKISLGQIAKGRANPDWDPPPRRTRTAKKTRPAATPDEIESAVEVNGLIMNGGLFHAWQMDPAQFDAAAATIATVGREDAAAILREASALFRSVEGDLTVDEDLLDEAGWERESDLSSAYFALPDPQDDLERALPDDHS